jgi:hypothetical protein
MHCPAGFPDGCWLMHFMTLQSLNCLVGRHLPARLSPHHLLPAWSRHALPDLTWPGRWGLGAQAWMQQLLARKGGWRGPARPAATAAPAMSAPSLGGAATRVRPGSGAWAGGGNWGEPGLGLADGAEGLEMRGPIKKAREPVYQPPPSIIAQVPATRRQAGTGTTNARTRLWRACPSGLSPRPTLCARPSIAW